MNFNEWLEHEQPSSAMGKARLVAVRLKARGYDVLLDQAKTGSIYVTAGRRMESGGFQTSFTIRLADHPIPGWQVGGWRPELKKYDIRYWRPLPEIFKCVDKAIEETEDEDN